MSFDKQPIIVMAGGTGGHVFPALAVADKLREQGESIIWFGTQAGIESRLVPNAGYPIEWLSVQGVRGKGLLLKAMAPFKLLYTCLQAFRLLKQHRPRAVLGMGGFVSGPGGLMAWVLRIPLIIHEQNAIPGLTNKLLSRVSNINYFAFPQAAEKIRKSIVVGNPVRHEISSISAPEIRLGGHDENQFNVLILGGSLGALNLNKTVPAALAEMNEQQRPNVKHQSGARHIQSCRETYQKYNVSADVVEFIDDMKAAYEWADFVICRSGALTVAELSAAGLASVLIPFPYAVDDHQYFNALFLEQAGAAIIIRDEALTADSLKQLILNLSTDREQLLEMSIKARAVSYTDAAEQVANGILQEAKR